MKTIEENEEYFINFGLKTGQVKNAHPIQKTEKSISSLDAKSV